MLDLGFFASIQALQQKKTMHSIDDVVKAVQDAYYEIRRDTLDDTFVTLMSVMEQILLSKGCNKFDIPHINKQQRRKNGERLDSLVCSEIAYQIGCESFNEL